MTYNVYDYNFNFIGTVTAPDAEAALAAAKKRWPFVVAPMVEELN